MKFEEKIQRIVENAKYTGTHSSDATRQILLLFTEMANNPPLLEHLEYADDTTCQGEWIHMYTKKRYYTSDLMFLYNYTSDDILKQLHKTSYLRPKTL